MNIQVYPTICDVMPNWLSRTTTALAVSAAMTLATVAIGYAEDLPPGISPRGEAADFVGHVSRINATDKFIDAYGKLEDDHPVINLNFLKFRPLRDGTSYGKYGDVAGKEIAAVGGGIVHAGLGITDASEIYGFSNEWDEVAFALYPRKRAYIQLQTDKDYQLAIPDRVAGTYRRMLYAISDGDKIYNATETVLGYHENGTLTSVEKGNVVLSEFLKFNEDGGRESYTKFAKAFEPLLKEAGGHVALSLNAEFPIVSQDYWDHFVAIVFPSREAMEKLLTSDAFLEINLDRLNGLERSLAVAANAAILTK